MSNIAPKTVRKSRSKKIASPEAIAAVVASIDPAAETATVAGPVDHHTQMGSWMSVDTDVVLEQTLADVELPINDTIADVLDARQSPTFEFGVTDTLETETAAGDPSQSISEGILDYADAIAFGGPIDNPIALLGGDIVPDMPIDAASETVDQLPEPVKTFDEITSGFDDDQVAQMAFDIATEIDMRCDFEEEKTATKTGTDNIQKTLKKLRSILVTKRAARVLLATQIAPDFLNDERHTGSRYNVYASGKLGDIVVGVTGGAVSNAINLSIMRSLFALRGKGILFTGEVAKACCSKQWKIDAAIAQHLIRHTVSTSTAPTQASSTMQALSTLGVVKASGPTRNPVYELTDAPIVAKLEKLLAA